MRGIVLQRRLANGERDTLLQLSAHGAGRVESAVSEPDADDGHTASSHDTERHIHDHIATTNDHNDQV